MVAIDMEGWNWISGCVNSLGQTTKVILEDCEEYREHDAR